MKMFVFTIALVLLSGCASIRPRVSVMNACPNSRVVISDRDAVVLADLQFGDRASIPLAPVPQTQLLTADVFIGNRTVIPFSQTFHVDVADYRDNYPMGPTSTPNGYSWTFERSSDGLTCTENLSSGGGGGSSTSRAHGRPAW